MWSADNEVINDKRWLRYVGFFGELSTNEFFQTSLWWKMFHFKQPKPQTTSNSLTRYKTNLQLPKQWASVYTNVQCDMRHILRECKYQSRQRKIRPNIRIEKIFVCESDGCDTAIPKIIVPVEQFEVWIGEPNLSTLVTCYNGDFWRDTIKRRQIRFLKLFKAPNHNLQSTSHNVPRRNCEVSDPGLVERNQFCGTFKTRLLVEVWM